MASAFRRLHAVQGPVEEQEASAPEEKLETHRNPQSLWRNGAPVCCIRGGCFTSNNDGAAIWGHAVASAESQVSNMERREGVGAGVVDGGHLSLAIGLQALNKVVSSRVRSYTLQSMLLHRAPGQQMYVPYAQGHTRLLSCATAMCACWVPWQCMQAYRVCPVCPNKRAGLQRKILSVICICKLYSLHQLQSV